MSKWKQPDSPPPPLFAGKKERDLVKQVNDELIERVIGQQIVYYPISLEKTDFHPVYGEAIKKSFLPPVRVYALVEYGGNQSNSDVFGIDKTSTITVSFHKRRLLEEQDLYVREGDFVLYGEQYYEITTITWQRQLFGQIDHRFEIIASCTRAREGLFNV
tara:strand:- start:511 stop:990 length:480 start_codon:yes stop_codon:yes gene_type:complete